MTTSFMETAGLGVFIEKHGNALYFGHGGADEGFRAELLVSRDKGYGAVVMANSDNGAILREVLRGVALPAEQEIIHPVAVGRRRGPALVVDQAAQRILNGLGLIVWVARAGLLHDLARPGPRARRDGLGEL